MRRSRPSQPQLTFEPPNPPRIREILARLTRHAAHLWAKFVDFVTFRTLAGELARLNDNFESVMLHFSIPRHSRAELTSPPPTQITVTRDDEAEMAFNEWLEEYRSAKSRAVVTPPLSDEDEFEDLR